MTPTIITKAQLAELDYVPRANLVNSITGYKSANLIATADLQGRTNVAVFSSVTHFGSNPPIVGHVTRPTSVARHTYDNIKEVPEVTINIVNYAMVEQMSLASTEYDKGINEFDKSGLTQEPSEVVRPPRVLESPVSFECAVDQVIELGDQGGAGNLVIARVLKMHVREEFLKADGKLDPLKLDLVGRMGENWYCHAGNDSLFEIPKPIQTKGIGVDQLSQSIRNSNILEPNHLGRMGNLDRLPTEAEVMEMKATDELKQIFLEFENQRDLIKDAIHYRGKQLLEEGKPFEALTTLMIVDLI